jgi:hypothetical protein
LFVGWLEHPVLLDAASAAVFAAGMRAVARADGDVHRRELDAIQAFESSLPPDAPATGAPWDGALRRAYVRTLAMVGMADGALTAPERSLIDALGRERGLTDEEIEAEVREVKLRFLQVFGGTPAMSAAAAQVAEELGLPADAVARLRGRG